jgi:hypothetical protein
MESVSILFPYPAEEAGLTRRDDDRSRGLGERLQELADRFGEWLDSVLPGEAPRPVPVPVRVRSRRGPPRRR